MTIWIINPYGTLPNTGWREYRTTMIAHACERQGIKVVSWTSNFDHRDKNYKSEKEDSKVIHSPLFETRVINVPPYTSNISFGRIRFEHFFSKRVYEIGKNEEQKPDVIISCEPALFMSYHISKLAKTLQSKLIVDIIDLWPELFSIVLPNSISFLGKVIFSPFYWWRAQFFRKANGLIAVAKNYEKVGSENAPHIPTKTIYWGVDVDTLQSDINNNKTIVPFNLQKKEPNEFRVIYAGTLGENYDLKTILAAADQLKYNKNIKFIIAGAGPLEEFIKFFIKNKQLTNTLFVGRLNPDVLTRSYAFCDIALSSYLNNSTVAMPIKAFDHLAAGLPTINSLGRDWGELVENKKVGLNYKPENVSSLVSCIEMLCSDPKLKHSMRLNCLRLAEQFDEKVQYGRYVNFVNQIAIK